MTTSTKKANDAKIVRVLKHVGYNTASKITDTLQGNIWRAYCVPESDVESPRSKSSAKTVAVKVTSQLLQEQGYGIVNSKKYRVEENIICEQSILKYLTHCDECPPSLVRFHRFFKTKTDYYLIMQDGGEGLFTFVRDSHKLITQGRMMSSHWRCVVRKIFKQMVHCVRYIHAKHVCHFDISLENFLVNDVSCKLRDADTRHHHGHKKRKSLIEIMTNDLQVKLCDFGLAQIFKTNDFTSNRCVGKTLYKSPECTKAKKHFNAKMNDIWCLGVCLFMMATGLCPWQMAHPDDETYSMMTNGFMKGVLKTWDLLHYVDDDLIDLLECIFQPESSRITIAEIEKHSWLKSAN
eukprot:CAMPEP_0202694766 /NCGR_PEP_ID=MMETSP1385-20130828/8537_1 /ASSEMBLY_ACC=CAM_ASM_000861 /TAXON_ID=933848 /ORGANISM="Elphidium margaritaceum" /LENGTH=349 /DNA_ID=CAMNT_0049350669 /DNA_START=41 /DNA_END=1090 /DNA_ORIENTATION=+